MHYMFLLFLTIHLKMQIFIFFLLFSQMLNLNPPLPWTTWQELRTESKTNSESMLSLMLEAKVGAHWKLGCQIKNKHCGNLLK